MLYPLSYEGPTREPGPEPGCGPPFWQQRSPTQPHTARDPAASGYPACAASFAAVISRISILRTLPVTVMGKSSTTSTYRGIL